MMGTGEGYRGCPCPRSLPPAGSCPSLWGTRSRPLAVNRAEPKLFHPSCVLPALMNSSKCE